MSHLHDALAEGGALKELWDHRHSRDVNESTWIDRDGDVKWFTRKRTCSEGENKLRCDFHGAAKYQGHNAAG